MNFSINTARIISFPILLATSICANGMDARELFKKVSPSIFVVVSRDSSGQVKSQGSGVQISKNRIITNCHVVDEAASVVLIQNENKIAATVKGRDKERDLCILSVDRPLDTPAVGISASSQLKQGQPVYALGAPLGLELTISDGIVSGLRKASGGFIIQTSAAISAGSSGGGLFDSDGRLVGITTFQYVKGQNLNFAVPAEWISQVESRESLESELRSRRDEYEKSISGLDIDNPTHRQKVIQLSRQYLQNDPEFIPALFNLGYALEKSGQAATAEAVWLKMVDLPIMDPSNHFHIGMGALYLSIFYDKARKESQAREAAAKAVRYFPLLLTLGHYWSFLKSQDDYRGAIEVYRQAVSLDPKSPEVWAYLGGSYMNIKDYENALRAFRKATQLKPDYEWAWLGYMLTLHSSGGNDELEKVVRYLYDNQRDLLNNILKYFKKN